jgi:hypothetical protein
MWDAACGGVCLAAVEDGGEEEVAAAAFGTVLSTEEAWIWFMGAYAHRAPSVLSRRLLRNPPPFLSPLLISWPSFLSPGRVALFRSVSDLPSATPGDEARMPT